MKKTTVKGTIDYTPKETALREFLQATILQIYQINGYERIMTPAIEDIENLDNSDGGENLNLIFKILKRGEKLDKSLTDSSGLADMGLRYDLTLPLSRYYANNKAKIIEPVKAIQIDKVYRAERPQKGRLREFIQCDIDILGSDSKDCETELILVTAKALLAIGISDFTVKINDRQILRSILLEMGFYEEQLDSVCITFDKLDKIGVPGIKDELLEKSFNKDSIGSLISMMEKLPITIEEFKKLYPSIESTDSIISIINDVKALSADQYKIEFDISLVRGQGYYSGVVFEIVSSDFKGSIAGGGRYDNLIGKFIGERVPAVGFSIGFERIYNILLEKNFIIPNKRNKLALLYEASFVEAYNKAEEFRTKYDVSIFEKPKKTSKFLNKLVESGYYGFYIYGQSEDIVIFNK